MDPVTIGLILSGAGTAVNAGVNYMNQRGQNKAAKQRQQQVDPWLQEILGGTAPGANSFNMGQDWLMQMMRSDPMGASNRAMEGMMAGGNPFDTTELFRSLGVLDERNRGDALAQVNAGASGLGQRFGTSMNREANNTMAQMVEAAAARNAGIGMQSHDSAQNRILGAAGQYGNNRAMEMGLAQALMGGSQAQNNQRMQALSMMLGMPMGQSPLTGVGSDIGSLGSLIAFMDMMKKAQGNAPNTGTSTPRS